MFRNTIMIPGGVKSKSRGFSLLAALFILLVLAGLAAFATNISGLHHGTPALAVQSVRAYYAAHSGIQWGAHEIVQTGGGGCANTSLTVGAFQVTVTCTPRAGGPFREKGQNFQIYDLTASASFGTFGDPDYVRRQINASVTDAP